MDDILQQLLQEEQELQFTSFNEETAWQIGCQLVERAGNENLAVTIDVMRGEHQIFHARKVRLVYRFEHSSFYIGQLLKSKGKRIEEAYLISETEYAPHGGCFPVIVKNTGVVGTVTVSGLAQEEDHKLVVQAIRDYLSREN